MPDPPHQAFLPLSQDETMLLVWVSCTASFWLSVLPVVGAVSPTMVAAIICHIRAINTGFIAFKAANDEERRSKIEFALIQHFSTERDPNFVRNLKRERQNELEGFTGKRRKSRLDHARAWNCVQQDFLGGVPTFNALQFERYFGITPTLFETHVMPALVKHSPDVFFTDEKVETMLHANRNFIRPQVKALNVLQITRFGTPAAAFIPYFQTGEETVRIAKRAFFQAICSDDNIRKTFFPPLTRDRAVKIAARHEAIHGVPGHLLNIDCSHVVWKNCPKAWAGAHADKDKKVSIVLEAGCDYDLKFHHAFFGMPGSNNDIDVWNNSDFRELMESGAFAKEIDPETPYFIHKEAFTGYWNTVDGIYPPLGRFVKTISVPVNGKQRRYVVWQEGTRKAVERGCSVDGRLSFRQPTIHWQPMMESIPVCETQSLIT